MERDDTRTIRFTSADQPPISLEGVVRLPLSGGLRSAPAAILCHPHPLTSNLHDPLMDAVAARLVRRSVATLQFNFRGVGASEGTFSDGSREPLDLAGAVTRILEEPVVDPNRLCLIGHAFGAIVALVYAAHDPRVRVVVAVSPPVARIAQGVGAFDRARMVITGEFDEVAPPHKLERWLETLPGGCALRVVAGGQHLLRDHVESATEEIARFVDHWALASAEA